MPLRLIRNRLLISIYYTFRVFPINKKKIVICNYQGKGYGDNAKYIVEKILDQKLDYDIVWLCKNTNDSMPTVVRKVKYNSISAFWEMSTAKIWIDNCRKPSFVRKRKGQFYVQTWHGGIALKRTEKDVETKLSNSYIKNAKHDSKIADLFISNSKFCTELYRSAFWYVGRILESGYPRNDILIKGSKDIKDKVFGYFGLHNGTKILLYAPTFRANCNIEVYDLQYNQILTALKQKYSCNWVFLIRLHPNISQKADAVSYNGQVINATHYSDMQELMAASDILITDYSSTMFEFMLMLKPVFLFATDIKEYTTDRDFYFDIFSLPFPVAENSQKLIEDIISFNETQYLNVITSFKSKIGLMEDGRAAEKIVKQLETLTC
jgi:CDP-glycerol glycerophosphotransferase